MTMRRAIVLGMLWAVGSATGADFVAAEQSAGPTDEPVAEAPDKRSEAAEGARSPLQSLLMGSTPEERERLAEERKHISKTAAGFGTDPTAIIGFYELDYGHGAFTNGLRTDTATAVAQLPLTPNWFIRATLPYVWADLNQPGGFTTNGAGDLTVRTGGRLYASENIALFIGTDASFPTAAKKELGTGKYSFGPGVGMAVPMARLKSLFFTLVQDFNSVGGDPSRDNLHFMQVQSGLNTIWSERWWTTVSMTWDMDWNNNRKTTMNLQGEVGHNFDDRWNVFANAGLGVIGRETFLGLDYTVQAGVRWVYQTPLFPERLMEQFPRK